MVVQVFAVVLPRLAIDPSGRAPLEGVVRGSQTVRGVHVMEERRKPLLPIPLCHVPYPLERR
jgi:hypothetical protein